MSDFSLFGEDLFGETITQDKKGVIRERFEFPPFSVLNAREGQWQERKRAWLSLGIKSEVGRGENLLKMSDTILQPDPEKRALARTYGSGDPGDLAAGFKRKELSGVLMKAPSSHPRYYEQKTAAETRLGRILGNEEFERDHWVLPEDSEIASGTSIFDPVLAEIFYRWFCPPGGLILDPFAGGSVRGLVAGLLDFRYYGIDLRAEQIEANEAQRAAIAPDADIVWRAGDSNLELPSAPDADFVFSCPPYGDLERYSDDPNDLSTLTWEGFSTLYASIIAKSIERLKPNRFACFVIGEYRDKKTGMYRGFVSMTINAFEAAGAHFYNEAILITAVGSLSIRIAKQFEASRKFGKTHQNVLVFCKGDPRIASATIRGQQPVERPLPRPQAPSPAPPLAAPSAPSAPLLGGLRTFLEAAREEDWAPDAPPELSGIDTVVLNFATNGLDWRAGDRPVGVTVSTLDGGLTRFLPFGFAGGNHDEDTIKRWLEREVRGKKIINANTRFDIHQAREWGIDLEEQGNTFSDISHTAALLDDHRKRFSLDMLAADYLPELPPVNRLDETQHHRYHASTAVEREKYTAELVAKLHGVMYPRIIEQDLTAVHNLEDDVIPAVVEMEKNAAPLDTELLEQWVKESEEEVDRLLAAITKEVGFAFSPTKDWEKLYRHFNIPITDLTATGAPSFTDSILARSDHPFVQMGRRADKLMSLRSKFLVPYYRQQYEGTLLYNLHQLRWESPQGGMGGTVTGRFSSSDFNIQQVPKPSKQDIKEYLIRKLFIPRDGLWFSADAMQIEFRIAAHFFNSRRLFDAYAADPMVSYHRVVHEMVSRIKDISYDHVKNLNFALLYGGGRDKVSQMLGVPREVSDQFVDAYHQAFPEVRQLIKQASTLAESRGYVKTIRGRRSRFPMVQTAEGGTFNRSYKAFNSVVQGGAADINKMKIVALHKARKQTGYIMRGTVHDETFGEVPDLESARMVKEILNQQSVDLRVPILWDASVGPNWADTTSV